MKWINFLYEKPMNGQYCLCKRAHGRDYTGLFFAMYREGVMNEWVDDNGLTRGVFFVDFWMDAHKLDKEATETMYED